MSRKKSKPKNSGQIDRRQESRNKRASGALAYLAYQIHAEQVPQSKENPAGDITPAPKTDHTRNTGESI